MNHRKEISVNQASDYFYWVDILRFLAALSILVWHYQHFYTTSPGIFPMALHGTIQPFYDYLSIFYRYGHTSVYLFWVISGFVFASIYLRKSVVSAREFFVNRFARLYPLHFLTLLAVAALQILSKSMTGDYLIYPKNDGYHFLLNLGFISHWGFQQGYSFNAPIWSVSTEIFIYIVFFFTIPWIVKGGMKALLFFLGCFGCLVVFQAPGDFWVCGVYFYAGCIVFHLWNNFNTYRWKIIPAGIAGLSAGLLLIISHFKFAGLLGQVVSFSSIVWLAASMDLLDVLKIGRRFKWLGDMTYGTYLWHIPIQIFLLLLLKYFSIGREIVSSRGFFLLFFSLVIAVAYISFHGFELPMRTRIRRSAKPK
jgi:peptidoglycan/LPS O-acetylase OafA/YrhL